MLPPRARSIAFAVPAVSDSAAAQRCSPQPSRSAISPLPPHDRCSEQCHQHLRRSTHQRLKRLRAKRMHYHEAGKLAASFNAGGKVERCFLVCRLSNSAMRSRSQVGSTGHPCDLSCVAAALTQLATVWWLIFNARDAAIAVPVHCHGDSLLVWGNVVATRFGVRCVGSNSSFPLAPPTRTANLTVRRGCPLTGRRIGV